MLTLAQTPADQEDLAALCADRPLGTREIFLGNAFYGGDAILRAYSGYEGILKAVVPHGPYWIIPAVWNDEAEAPVPVIFFFNPIMQEAFEKETTKVVLPLAFPFLYVLELVKAQPRPARRGTIFFPGHSSHRATAKMDFAGLAARLAELADEYQPLTVCMFWKDYLLGYHRAFQERGMSLVSAGHMYDPDFLCRFYHLCSRHRYAASNYTLSSATFYAVKAGCAFFFLDPSEYRFDVGGVDALYMPKRQFDDRLANMFQAPRPATTPEQMEFVDYILGTAYLTSPEELLQQLRTVDKWDKRRIWARRPDGGKKLMLPTYFKRKISSLWFVLGKWREVLKARLKDLGQKWGGLGSLFSRR
ncbi:MAG: hypothetical protein Q8M54_00785 [Desulfobaccales bacterium]|nr:hypothetical protein [Desulfobaccales bacterium]